MARRSSIGPIGSGRKGWRQDAVRLAGVVRRSRRALLLGTALQATVVLVLALPAQAQVAANARPTGGVVVGGSASISRGANTTTIDQSSERAALNWQSFNVGAQQSVDFQQPNASAVALNRVVGPNPSEIAGRITASGQVILENQDGITFLKGAQINTAGFLATAAGITNKNFMAGHMVFDQAAAPGAKIVNEGHITVHQAGIAALVAPQVANSGVITAILGRVVLAGATRYTLDLYGDGLVSIDVTGAVKQIPLAGGRAVTALVTNSGTLLAAGGRIELTARAAAGLVQELVAAGGRIAAPSVGAHTGRVVLNGIGGSIVVAGALLAQGQAAGTTGGQIEVAAQGGDVVLVHGARIDASGAAGGGTIAVGTDLARAAGGPQVTPAVLSHDVTVSRGATIAANATGRGNGGRITVLSSDTTVMDGAISARGGAAGGDGGFVEVSGRTLGFDGQVNVGAVQGRLGTVLFDPATLDVVAGTSIGSGTLDNTLTTDLGTILVSIDAGGTDTVSNFAINQIGSAGNVLLQAGTLLDVQAAVSVKNGLALQSGDNLVIDPGASITAGGNILLSAADTSISGHNAAGSITLSANITTTSGTLALSAGTGGIALGTALLNAPTVDLSTTGGGVSQGSGGAIVASALQSSGTIGGGATLTGSNTVAVLGSVAANGGNFTLTDAGMSAGTLTVSGPLTANDVILGGAGSLAITGSIGVGNTGTIALEAGSSGISETGGSLAGGTLIGNGSIGGPVALSGSNTIATLGSVTVSSGNFVLTDGGKTGVLTVNGPVSAANISLTGAGSLLVAGTIAPGGQAYLGAVGAGGVSIGSAGSVGATGKLISVRADSFSVASGGTVVGGALELAPNTSGGVVTLGATGSSGLSLTSLAGIGPTLLRIGAVTPVGGSVTPIAGSIAVNGPFGTSTVNLELDATGPVTEGTGTLTAGALSGTIAGGSVSLGATANQISELGGFTVAGGTLLVDAGSGVGSNTLDIVGTVSANAITLRDAALLVNGSVIASTQAELDATVGAIQIGPSSAGTIAAPGHTVGLIASDITVGAAGGTVIAGTIEVAPNTTTAVVTLGGSPSSLGLDTLLGEGETLLRIGAVTPVGGTATATAGTINVAGAFGTSTVNLELDATTLIAQSGGALAAATLSGPLNTGSVALTGTNAVATLGSFTTGAGSAFAFVDASDKALSVTGSIAATGISISAGTLDISSVLNAGTVSGNTLALASTGPGTLGIDGGAVLSGATIALNGGTSVVNLTSASAVTSGTLLSLAGAGVTQSATGIITAPTLISTGSVTGGVDLAGTANAIGTLAAFTLTTGPNLAITDSAARSLTLTGSVVASTIDTNAGRIIVAGPVGNQTLASTVSLIAEGGGISFAAGAVIDAGFNDHQLVLSTSGGGVTAAANARVGAQYLETSGSVVGTVDFSQSTNTISVISGFTVIGGNLLLNDGTGLPLGVLGTVAVPRGTIALGASSLDFSGGGTLFAADVALAPFGTGSLVTLGTAAGFALPGSVFSNGQITAAEVDIGSLNHGTVTNAGTIAITDSLVPVASTLGLYSTGSITESGVGAITVGTLIGQAAQGINLAGANTIGTIISLAPGDNQSFLLDNAASLAAIGGTVDLGSGTYRYSDPNGTVTVSGTIIAAGITIDPVEIDVTGRLNPTAGTIALDATTGGITLEATSFLDAPGQTVDFTTTGGGVLQKGGQIFAGTLQSSGSVVGTVSLLAGSNTIASIGSFVVSGGDFLLNDTGETGVLTVGNTLVANNVTLTGSAGSTGEIDVNGGTIAGTATVLLGADSLMLASGSIGASNGAVSLIAGGGGVSIGAGMTIDPGVSGTLTLGASGDGVNEASGGRIIAGTLLSNGVVVGAVDLPGANQIAGFGNFSVNGDLVLADGNESGNLTVAGFVTANNVTLGAGGLTPGGLVIAGSTLGPAAGGTITANGTGLTLAAGGSGMQLLGDLVVAGGTLALASTGGGITEAGSVVAGGNTVAVAGLITAQDLVSLGTVAGGTIVTGSTIGVVLASPNNDVGTIGNFTFGPGYYQGFTLADGGAAVLTVAGSLSAAQTGGVAFDPVTLGLGSSGLPGKILVSGTIVPGYGSTALLDAGTGGISIAPGGSVGAINNVTVDLDTHDGGVTEDKAGVIQAAFLQSSSGVAGGVVLAGTNNTIGTLNSFVVSGGGFSLVDIPAQELVIAGSVAAPGTIALAVDRLDLGSGSLVAGGGTGVVAIAPAGTGAAVTLLSSGPVGAGTVTVNGQINAGTIDIGSLDGGGKITASSISIAAAVSLPVGTVFNLYSNGSIGQGSGDSLTAGGLGGAAAGSVVLTEANNIGTLAGFKVTSPGTDFDLVDTSSLTVNGSVAAPGQVYLQDSAAGGITLATGGVLDAAATDSLRTDAFLISGGSIANTAATLELAPNTTATVETLGGSGTGLSLAALTDIAPATLRFGAVTTPGGTLVTTAGSIAVAGPFGAAADAIDLETTGSIGGAGPLMAGTLTGTSTGTTDLSGANVITTLGSFTAAGFTLVDTGPLSVNGKVDGSSLASITDGTGSISVPGTIAATAGGAGAVLLNGGTIAIGGLVTDGGAGTTTLIATTGPITETGTLLVGTLTGNSGTSATSLTGANTIATLGSFTAAGFTLDAGSALVVNGPVAGGSLASITDSASLGVPGTISAAAVLLSGGNLGIGGTVTASGSGPMTLIATGGTIAETGSLIAGTLTGSSTGATSLTEASASANQIPTLTSFDATGGFTFIDGAPLTVTGNLTGHSLAAITDSGSISVPGTIAATAGGAGAILLDGGTLTIGGLINDGGAGATTLIATGGPITETGTLLVGTLTGNSGASATNLTGATATTNTIATLGSFTAAGFTLDTGSALVVNGPVAGGSLASITDSASLGVPGTISAAAVLLSGGNLGIGGTVTASGSGPMTLIATGGTIAETGSLIAGTLTGSSTGATSLTGASASANQIPTLTSFDATGGFTFIDGAPLTVTGNLTGHSLAAITDSGSISVPSTVSASTILLQGTDLSAAGRITDGGAGATTLVATAGSITVPGTLHVGTLSGSSTGTTDLGGSNTIAALGSFTADGFTLNDPGANLDLSGVVGANAFAALTVPGTLSIAGTLTAGTITLNTGSLDVTGVLDGTTGVTLAIGGNATAPGSIDTALLTGTLGGTLDARGNNLIAAVENLTAGAVLMTDNEGLTLGGAIDAPLIEINTGAHQIALAAGTDLTTGGSARPNGVFGRNFVDPASDPGAFGGGAYLSDFVQNGVLNLIGIGGHPAILELTANNGGPITLSSSGGINGPTSWLILNLYGTQSGTAVGNVFVRWLDVGFSPNSAGGGASLGGTVDGVGGQAAAGLAYIHPQADARFRLNACAIASVNCVVLPVEALPITNPLEQFSLTSFFNSEDFEDLFLPLVSRRDY